MLRECYWRSKQCEEFVSYQSHGSSETDASVDTFVGLLIIVRYIRQVCEPKFEKSEDIKLHLYTKQQLITIMEQGMMPEAVMQAPLWKLINSVL